MLSPHPRRRAWRLPATVVTGLLLVPLAAACSSSSSGSSASPTAGATTATATELRTAWPSDITTLDPANLSTAQDHELTRNIYQPLESPMFATKADGSLNYVGAKVVPALAQSWTIGDDSITYHLRPNVKFYGTDDVVTSEDVKWSLDRIFSTPGSGDFEANGIQSADDIHIVDPNTVTIDFKNTQGQPTPVTPTLMAIFDQPYTSIIDENQVKPYETASDPTGANWLRSHAAGTGPYYIASRTPGQSLTLQAVPDSWTPQPSYQTVSIRVTSGSIPSLLQSGDINVGEYGMTNAQVNSLAQSGMDVVWEETGNFDMFAITSGPASQVGALGNTDVRQAIAYAMPYKEILQDIVFGRGSRDDSIVSTTAPEYTPAWAQYQTNLTKARSLMKAAGNPSVKVPLYYLEGDVDQTNTAILIQASLKQIGIATTLTPETQAGLFDVVDARSTPASSAQVGPPGVELFNWTAWTDDPKIVIGYWTTTGGINNYSLWSSPAVDAANTQYSLQPTSAARTAAYKQAQTTIADAAPVIPVVSTGTVTVVARGISGVSFSPTGSGRFWTMHPTGKTNPLDAMFE